ncbi:MAG: histidine phosphatase family protein [Ardenticatenaceae bacterium]
MIHRDFECEFYFIRHGESVSNATPGYAAGIDHNAPLTDKGFAQAKLLGERLKLEGVKFDRVYSSSLTRCIQTTQTMLEAMGQFNGDFPKVDAIIEQQIPGWRGVRSEDVMTHEMLAYMRAKGAHFVPPEGESYRMVQRRYANWLEDEIIYNKKLMEKPINLKVAVVGHGAASRCIFHYIMGFDESFIWRFALDNTSVSRFKFNKDGWFPICINDSSHVRYAGLTAESAVTA